MEQKKSNHIISVNSENGIYWQGDNIFRHTRLIKALIEKAASQRKTGVASATFFRDRNARSIEG